MHAVNPLWIQQQLLRKGRSKNCIPFGVGWRQPTTLLQPNSKPTALLQPTAQPSTPMQVTTSPSWKAEAPYARRCFFGHKSGCSPCAPSLDFFGFRPFFFNIRPESSLFGFTLFGFFVICYEYAVVFWVIHFVSPLKLCCLMVTNVNAMNIALILWNCVFQESIKINFSNFACLCTNYARISVAYFFR